MAVINATDIRQEGNVIYIKSNPAVGVLALTGFADNASGTNPPNTVFSKTFRYSLNGITYSDWMPLTVPNITAIQVQQTDTIILELAYEKLPFSSTTLAVSSATISANLATLTEPEYFKNSIFSEYFGSNDIAVLKWYVAVLEKLYGKGLIPPFIDRLNDYGLPDDFVDFWKAIARFFAYFVTYARTFQNFQDNQELLTEFLEERGMKTSSYSILQELNLLMEKFYNQVAKRGTIHIIDKVIDGADVDGELLRLIYFNGQSDEFLFNFYKKEHFGWNLGNSSPLHRSLYLNDNVNKAYETGFDVEDLTKYPTTGTVAKVTDGAHTVMNVGSASGISSTGGLKYIRIDPGMDYEVSFLMKLTSGNFNFGVNVYDNSHNAVSCTSEEDGTATNFFLQSATLVRNDKYILVRGFLYNSAKAVVNGSTLELNQGNNLILPADAAYIIPKIITGSASTAKIYGLRLLPMQTEYSRGFIQVRNFISCWLKNNNAKYNLNQVREYIIRYLIPYNSHIRLTSLGASGYNHIIDNGGTYWLPDSPVCERVRFIPSDPACEVKYKWIVDPATAYCETV